MGMGVARHKDGSLTRRVSDDLRQQILSGARAPGEKLPSEAQLIEAYKVSRTVVRDALSALRADGLVEPRQGAGVFVLAMASPALDSVDPRQISSVVEALELRTALEVEAAYLAATRCSPLQEEAIITRHLDVGQRIKAGLATAEADFQFHIAIAEASNNRRFVDLLTTLGGKMIPRAALPDDKVSAPTPYLDRIYEEHRVIVEAIANRDPIGAREAMRAHLQGSQQRYRAHIRDNFSNLS